MRYLWCGYLYHIRSVSADVCGGSMHVCNAVAHVHRQLVAQRVLGLTSQHHVDRILDQHRVTHAAFRKVTMEIHKPRLRACEQRSSCFPTLDSVFDHEAVSAESRARLTPGNSPERSCFVAARRSEWRAENPVFCSSRQIYCV